MKQIGLLLAVFLMGVWLVGCMAGEADDLADRVQAMMDGDAGAYVVLTLPGTVDAALTQQLDAAGIVLFDPLGEYRYQAYVPLTAVPTLTALHDNNVIIDVTAIDPTTKIKGDFADAQAPYAIVVHFYTAPTESETAVLSDTMVVEQTAVGVMNFVEGQATGAQIKQLVELPFVKLVEEAVVSSGGDGS
ncbi:MAG: hypothetical protein R6X34_28105 [Chloroflexota bacterium]